jgi:hypothetical protein
MMRAILRRWRGSAMLALPVCGLLAACSTEPSDSPFRGTFAVLYEPAQLISATEQCDRLVTHVLLELDEEGTFELSANVQDDCTRVGGGFADAGVFRLGTYTRQSGVLSFTSNGGTAPEFTGTLDVGAIVLVFLPGLAGLSSPVELRVPRVRTGPSVSRRVPPNPQMQPTGRGGPVLRSGVT